MLAQDAAVVQLRPHHTMIRRHSRGAIKTTVIGSSNLLETASTRPIKRRTSRPLRQDLIESYLEQATGANSVHQPPHPATQYVRNDARDDVTDADIGQQWLQQACLQDSTDPTKSALELAATWGPLEQEVINQFVSDMEDVLPDAFQTIVECLQDLLLIPQGVEGVEESAEVEDPPNDAANQEATSFQVEANAVAAAAQAAEAAAMAAAAQATTAATAATAAAAQAAAVAASEPRNEARRAATSTSLIPRRVLNPVQPSHRQQATAAARLPPIIQPHPVDLTESPPRQPPAYNSLPPGFRQLQQPPEYPPIRQPFHHVYPPYNHPGQQYLPPQALAPPPFQAAQAYASPPFQTAHHRPLQGYPTTAPAYSASHLYPFAKKTGSTKH